GVPNLKPSSAPGRRLTDPGARPALRPHAAEPPPPPSPPPPAVSGAVNEARRRDPTRGAGDGGKETDLATLGNLCVDVVLSVPQLPPAPREERKAYMERLAASPPDQKFGNCNL
ncbi:unnamed protein product, partial [Urochloa humidicola]